MYSLTVSLWLTTEGSTVEGATQTESNANATESIAGERPLERDKTPFFFSRLFIHRSKGPSTPPEKV